MKPRVLIVDDEVLLSDTIRRPLRDEFDFRSVQRVSEAERLLRSETFEAVLLDLKVLDSSGTSTFWRVKAAAEGTPIVVMTGSVGDAEKLQLMQGGASSIIEKPPINIGEVRDALLLAVNRDSLGQRTPVGLNSKDAVPHLDLFERIRGMWREDLSDLSRQLDKQIDLKFQALEATIKRTDSRPPPSQVSKKNSWTEHARNIGVLIGSIIVTAASAHNCAAPSHATSAPQPAQSVGK